MSLFLCILQNKSSISLFCMIISSFPNILCWRDYPFPMCILGTLVKDQLAIYLLIYFWALYSLPLVYMIVFKPVPHCFYNSHFIIYFEIRKCGASGLFFFLNIDLAIYCLLWFQINFRTIFLPYFCQKCHWDGSKI